MSRAKPYTNDIYNAGWLPYANDIYKSADGEYNVSIIHINCSHTAISIVEPQDDADTFINSCGETGERPANINMLDIINAGIVSDEVLTRKVTIAVELKSNKADVTYKDIIDALSEEPTKDYVHQQNVKVYNGLLNFVSRNGLTANSFRDVIQAATASANDANQSITDFLITQVDVQPFDWGNDDD